MICTVWWYWQLVLDMHILYIKNGRRVFVWNFSQHFLSLIAFKLNFWTNIYLYREEAAASIVQQYHVHLVRWVEERRSRNEVWQLLFNPFLIHVRKTGMCNPMRFVYFFRIQLHYLSLQTCWCSMVQTEKMLLKLVSLKIN